MTTGDLDTLTIARRLKAVGFSEDQAEAVTSVLRETRATDLTTLVTKIDLSSEIGAVRADVRAEIGVAKNDLRREIAEVKFEILKWVISAIGFQTIVVVGAIVARTRGLR